MSENKTFYITTPIYYPSDNPHIGHAYTTVAADTMTRYKKLRGYDTFFLTGTDEHGQKIQRRAEAAGMEPQAFVDKIIMDFQKLWKTLMIDYDDFIRTTEQRHIEFVQKMFKMIYDKGDIYKAEYQGWYCTPCETFFTERQLAEGHTCPDCGRPVEKMNEESYFFKMSKYADRWLQYIEENPDFIQPAIRKNEMINFVKQGLEDLCVSRTTFSWGIPVPFDSKHVVYVWFDALFNYISALESHEGYYQKYWPADVHLMGKDIIRFHSIIWPTILMAADMPLPKKVLGHGWVLLGDTKMSKSKGNVIDPIVLSQKYSADAIRYFLMREMQTGMDCNYSEQAMALRINTDLANDYGNLLSRSTAMIGKFQQGIVEAPTKATEFDADLIALTRTTPQAFAKLMDDLQWSNALAEVWKLVNKANKYVDDAAPWALNKAGEKEKLASVLYNLVEIIRMVTIMVGPFMPSIPAKVWAQLGIGDKPELHCWESLEFGLFPQGTKIDRGEPLFPRIDLESIDSLPLAQEQTAEADEITIEEIGINDVPDIPTDRAVIERILNTETEIVTPSEPVAPEISIEDFAKLDLRVVKVLACEKVPKADKLLKFRLQLGDEERTVLSGIAEYYQPEQLIGRNLILIANLKPRTIRGIESRGMLLSACGKDKLQLLEIADMPSGVKIE